MSSQGSSSSVATMVVRNPFPPAEPALPPSRTPTALRSTRPGCDPMKSLVEDPAKTLAQPRVHPLAIMGLLKDKNPLPEYNVMVCMSQGIPTISVPPPGATNDVSLGPKISCPFRDINSCCLSCGLLELRFIMRSQEYRLRTCSAGAICSMHALFGGPGMCLQTHMPAIRPSPESRCLCRTDQGQVALEMSHIWAGAIRAFGHALQHAPAQLAAHSAWATYEVQLDNAVTAHPWVCASPLAFKEALEETVRQLNANGQEMTPVEFLTMYMASVAEGHVIPDAQQASKSLAAYASLLLNAAIGEHCWNLGLTMGKYLGIQATAEQRLPNRLQAAKDLHLIMFGETNPLLTGMALLHPIVCGLCAHLFLTPADAVRYFEIFPQCRVGPAFASKIGMLRDLEQKAKGSYAHFLYIMSALRLPLVWRMAPAAAVQELAVDYVSQRKTLALTKKLCIDFPPQVRRDSNGHLPLPLQTPFLLWEKYGADRERVVNPGRVCFGEPYERSYAQQLPPLSLEKLAPGPLSEYRARHQSAWAHAMCQLTHLPCGWECKYEALNATGQTMPLDIKIEIAAAVETAEGKPTNRTFYGIHWADIDEEEELPPALFNSWIREMSSPSNATPSSVETTITTTTPTTRKET